MSCNICSEEDFNLYKCTTCTGEMCGNCLSEVNKLSKGCPCCRKNLDYSDPNCKAIKPVATKNIREPYSKKTLLGGLIELDIHYDENMDSWRLIFTDLLMFGGIGYHIGARGYEIGGIEKPFIKHINLIYQGEECITTEDKQKHYTTISHSSPIIRVTGWGHTIDAEAGRTNATPRHRCNYCTKDYVGLTTLKAHLFKIHKKTL